MYLFVSLSQCRYDVLKDYCLLRKTSKSGDGPCMEWSDVVGEVSVMNSNESGCEGHNITVKMLTKMAYLK